MPAVTVVMPLFNRRATIAAAVDSVLAQEFTEFELIVVDDASTDGGAEVVARVGDPRVRLLRQPETRGIGVARNRGIDAARAEIISFLDSYEVYLPNKLGFVVDYFARHPEIEVLLDSCEIVYPPEKNRPPARRVHPVLSDSARIAEGILARRISKATPGLSVRRSTLQRVGLFDESLRSRPEFDLVLRLTENARCATTDEVLWRKFWSEGTVAAHAQARIDSLLEMCARHPESLVARSYRVGLARDLARHVLRLAGKGRVALIGADLRRFAAAHGAATTARLLGEGTVEILRRAVVRTRPLR